MSKYCPAGMESDEEDDDYNVRTQRWRGVRKTAQNQKITIIPDVTATAGLNGQPFDTKLTSDEELQLQALRSKFTTYKQGPVLSRQIRQLYLSVPNPYTYALRLYANCRDTTSTKCTSLAFSLLDEIRALVESTTETKEQFSEILSDNDRMVAFNLVRKYTPFYASVTAGFGLARRPYLFADKIRHLAQNDHCYKEACMWAHEMYLFEEHFDLFVFIVPLIMQDKVPMVEDYVRRAGESMQRALVVFLDGLLDRRTEGGSATSVHNRCGELISQHGYTDVNMLKLQPKPLSKLIMRLTKMFRLNADCIPNVYRAKNYGALQFLLHKQFVEHSLSVEAWREMVRETVPRKQDAIELQLELMTQCCLNDDRDDALFWATYFCISKDRWPYRLLEFANELQNTGDHTPKVIDNPAQKLQHPSAQTALPVLMLPQRMSDSIQFVCNATEFQSAIDDLTAQSLVAFDAEWKPSFCTENELALIQLATHNKVYLLDVPQLLDLEEHWSRLANEVFNSDDIIKLCFSPSSDLMLFGRVLPGFAGIAQTIVGMIDLQELWQLLNRQPRRNFCFPHSEMKTVPDAAASTPSNHNWQQCGGSSGGSSGGAPLSGLVALCLGKHLDKSNQFSNWQQRPLRPMQVQYAALDAYCLIECFEVIRDMYETASRNDFQELLAPLLMPKRNRSDAGQTGHRQRMASASTLRHQLNTAETTIHNLPTRMPLAMKPSLGPPRQHRSQSFQTTRPMAQQIPVNQSFFRLQTFSEQQPVPTQETHQQISVRFQHHSQFPQPSRLQNMQPLPTPSPLYLQQLGSYHPADSIQCFANSCQRCAYPDRRCYTVQQMRDMCANGQWRAERGILDSTTELVTEMGAKIEWHTVPQHLLHLSDTPVYRFLVCTQCGLVTTENQ